MPNFSGTGVAISGLVFAAALTLNSAPAAAEAFIYSFSHACAGFVSSSTCADDFRVGDPATSSVSRSYSFTESSGLGGINYGAQASAVAAPTSFSLFGQAGGSSDGIDLAFGIAQASALIIYNDTISTTGSGHATLVIPWTVDGAISVTGTSSGSPTSGGTFGISFCNSIPTGAATGGVACSANGVPYATGTNGIVDQLFSGPYAKTWLLRFSIELGVDFDINTQFKLGLSAVAPGGIAEADFLHTGTLGPAQVLDSFGNPIPDVSITSALGIDYFSPGDGSGPGGPTDIPEPSPMTLLLGLLPLLFGRRAAAAESSVGCKRSGV
jgi:hypothetical protein